MGERITSVHLPGAGSGLSDFGRRSRAEMLQMIRDHARLQAEQAKKILAAPDEAFVVETFIGPWAQRKRETVTD